MVFALHQHESAMGTLVSPHSEPPSHLPLHPIPLGWPTALALDSLLHVYDVHWSSLLHKNMKRFTNLCVSLAQKPC